MATLNAGNMAMHEKVLTYGMIVAAVADALTAVACWVLVFSL